MGLDELKEQSSTGNRIDEGAKEEDQQEFAALIHDELDKIDAGEAPESVHAWDAPTAALLRALDDDPERMEQLRTALGVDDGRGSQSELARRAMRRGLRDAAPELMNTLRETVRDRMVDGI